MREDLLDVYKKAIQQQFEKEKNGLYSSYLIQNSRAKLRQLCVERFKGNNQINDLNAFKIFFGFEFGEGNLNKLKSETDRFRPIENFFKKSSDTNDLATLELAAILVDFRPRPFLKFGKEYFKDEIVVEKIVTKNDFVKTAAIGVDSVDESSIVSKAKRKRNIVFGFAAMTLVLGIYTVKNVIFPENQCMQWQIDHYEMIDCKTERNNFFADAPIVPINKEALELKKIKVCDTTAFFKSDKAIVWYCKKDNVPEFFNNLGDGFHPVTGKSLKPVTKYIINKYVKNLTSYPHK
ncbi:hypothetical protein [Flavobacterium sp.]|uniref:hypothetical protein n=1 Tax=Flavobacterium sp. TaxID=239 RepID=UPI0024878E31|nr:hypothetical protein [Flavobacterium sp.]MDI1315781.1 hypothetical protein [Flavobacterium sp.]